MQSTWVFGCHSLSLSSSPGAGTVFHSDSHAKTRQESRPIPVGCSWVPWAITTGPPLYAIFVKAAVRPQDSELTCSKLLAEVLGLV